VSNNGSLQQKLGPTLPLIIMSLGFLAMYVPSYLGLANTIWSDSEEMHGPIVLCVAAWALYGMRAQLVNVTEDKPRKLVGALVFATGLFFFFVGKVLGILVFEIGSQLFVLAGILILIGGFTLLRQAIFPLVFVLFMVPLPGNLVDSLTGSLKQIVSVIAEQVLYTAGYPIARSGVTITIGQYQLLVADACSGLKSMFSLSAIGFLYIYLVKHTSKLRNSLLIASLLPIAFAANIIRVLVLILVTYHFGDAAGQGFVHDFAGLILFMLAIFILAAFDSFLGFFLRTKEATARRHPEKQS
jgi:exosortase B